MVERVRKVAGFEYNSQILERPIDNALEEGYTPPRALEIPPMPDSDEFVYRWVRYRNGDAEDHTSVSSRMRDGWVFVQETDVPPGYVFPGLRSSIAALAGVATNGDLVLAKLSRKRSQAIQRYYQDAANNAEQAIDASRIKTDDSRYTVDNHSSREVSRGRPRFS